MQIRRTMYVLFMLAVSLFASWSCSSAPDRQLVIVQTDTWSATKGTAYRFIGRPGSWKQVGASFEVSVGRGGLGWGVGQHGQTLSDDPIKMEGDGRAPAGRFAITSAFGRGQRSMAVPYEEIKPGRVCVDDAEASTYNTFQRTPGSGPQWSSAEPLFDIDVYDLGIVIAHNAEPTFPGRGSCIFLHRWQSVGAPTAGCTAMSEDHLRALAGWLNPALTPSLVQLPKTQYLAVRKAWGLPSLR